VVLVFVMPFFGLLSRAAKVFYPTLVLFTLCTVVGMWLMRYIEVYPSEYGVVPHAPFGIWEIGVLLLYAGTWAWVYASFMDAFPPLNTIEVGMPRMPKGAMACCARSVSTFATSARPTYSRAISSTKGAIILHGPHQSA